jgi:hypothetical protein
MCEAVCEEAPAVRRALEAHGPLSEAILAGVMRLAEHKVCHRPFAAQCMCPVSPSMLTGQSTTCTGGGVHLYSFRTCAQQ